MIKLDKNGLVVNTITANTLINDKGESNNVSDLLVSTGDTISGNFQIDDNTDYLRIGYKVGNWTGYGANITLFSKNIEGTCPGGFSLEAADDKMRVRLKGYPDGLLSWNDAIYFNGTMGTGSASIVCDPNKSHLILGYTSDAGANLALYNNNSDNSGAFSLGAKNSEGTKIFLTGNANGNLTWGGHSVIALSPGCIISMAADSLPPGGWLICHGQAVSRTTYAKLFAAIGTTYGEGDGSTTFNVPSTVNKVIMGAVSTDFGKSKASALPDIKGVISTRKDASTSDYYGSITSASGAFSIAKGTYSGENAGIKTEGSSYGLDTISFNASNSNSIYGTSTIVQPPALMIRHYIKY
jgi:hypothetical protein